MRIEKIRKGREYQWHGNGFGGSSEACQYGIFDGEELIATIIKTGGCRYMEPTEWTVETTKEHTFQDYFGKTVTCKRIICRTRTLKEAKSQSVIKLESLNN